uniref:Nudix hydrolase domain-containing protein n=1 Tax=Macrostomum lignano TaxID=282301 RepID=A0A1I8FGA6_9PLAT
TPARLRTQRWAARPISRAAAAPASWPPTSPPRRPSWPRCPPRTSGSWLTMASPRGVRSAVLVCLACDCPRPGEAGGGNRPRRSRCPRIRGAAHQAFDATDVILRTGVVPGGKSDPGADAGPVATALREAAEEIGLSPSLVRVLAVLPVMPLGRHLVTPVLATTWRPGSAGSALAPNPDEVDELLTPPLRWALPDGGAPAAGRLEFRSPPRGRWLDCDISPCCRCGPAWPCFGFTCHLLVLAACICHRRYPLYPAGALLPRPAAAGPVGWPGPPAARP